MTIKSLIGSASRPMTREESEVFLTGAMHQDLQTELDESFSEELGFSGKVLERRLSSYSTAKITKGLAIFLVFMSKGNPGNLVMWAYTMHVIAKQRNLKLISIHEFVDEFPMGVPSEEGLVDTWDSQKSLGDNLLDVRSTWS